MKTTQKERIIRYIREFGSITSLDAYNDLGITQLRSQARPIKKRGLSI